MIPFDQYQRYHFIRKVLDILAHGRHCKIVEIGSGDGPLRELTPDHTLVTVDHRAIESIDVRGNGTMLPFPDAAFDFVVSTDTIEHIPADHREKLLKELVRIASDAMILGFPHNDELVRQSDRMLFEFIKSTQGIEYPFLKEHMEYGLPESAEIREMLRQTGLEIVEFQQTNLFSWLPLMMSNFLAQKDAEFRESYEMLNQLFNQYYEESSHAPPHYRTFFLCLRSSASRSMRKKLEQLQREDIVPNSNDFALTSLTLAFSFQSALERTKQQVSRLETEKEQRDELIRQRAAALAQLEIHLDAANAQKEELQKQLVVAETQKEDLQKRLEVTETEKQDLQKRLEVAEKQKEERDALISDLQNRFAVIQKQKAEQDVLIGNLQNRVSEMESQKQHNDKTITEQSVALDDLKRRFASVQKLKEEADTSISQLQIRVRELEEVKAQSEAAIQQQAAQIKNLQDYLNLFLTHPAYKVYRAFKHLLGKK